MTNEKKHKQPKYSLEFKQDAVKLVRRKATANTRLPIIRAYP
jgi:transposase-like protein